MTHPRTLAFSLALVAFAFGCSDDDDDDDATTPDTAAETTEAVSETTAGTEAAETEETTAETDAQEPEETTAATEAAEETAAGEAGGSGCLSGTFDIVTITSLGATTGLPFDIEGDVTGLTISFDGVAWEIAAADAELQAEAGGVTGSLSLDGTAAGQFVATDDAVAFDLESADGTASAEAAGTSVELGFGDVIQALNPSGTGTIACGEDEATLTTDSVEMTLVPA
jgi:hypothetical protein